MALFFFFANVPKDYRLSLTHSLWRLISMGRSEAKVATEEVKQAIVSQLLQLLLFSLAGKLILARMKYNERTDAHLDKCSRSE